MDWYQVVKDFAQPVATLGAASAVAVFAYRQWRTADEQAKTALDKLKLDLFERRYAIYVELKKVLKTVLNEGNRPTFNEYEIVASYVILDEAISSSRQSSAIGSKRSALIASGV